MKDIEGFTDVFLALETVQSVFVYRPLKARAVTDPQKPSLRIHAIREIRFFRGGLRYRRDYVVYHGHGNDLFET